MPRTAQIAVKVTPEIKQQLEAARGTTPMSEFVARIIDAYFAPTITHN